MTDVAVQGPAAAPRRRGRWGERSVTAVAALFALFLGLPVLTLVGRAVLTGSLQVALVAQNAGEVAQAACGDGMVGAKPCFADG